MGWGGRVTGAVITILLFVTVGTALSRLLGRMQPFAAGAGIVGVSLWILQLAGVSLSAGAAIIVVAALLVLWRTRKTAVSQTRFHYPLLPTLLALIPILWLVAVTMVIPLHDFDGRAFWLLKAKAIALEDSVSGPFFLGETTSPRNSYPLLIPLDAAVIMELAGERDDRHVRLFYVLMAVAFALEIRRGLSVAASPAIGAWCAAVFLWLPQILIEVEGGATSAYNDIAMGMFTGAAFFELRERGSPLRFGLWTALLVLTKSEGLPLALLLLAIGAIVMRKRILVASLPVAGAVTLLLVWRSGVSRSDELDFASLVLTLPRNLARFGESLLAVAGQVVAFHDWGLLIAAIVAAALFLIWKGRSAELLLPAAVVLPMLGLYAAVFAVSDWDMIVMSENLAPRVMTHLLAPLLFVLAAAMRDASSPGETGVTSSAGKRGSRREAGITASVLGRRS
jgi:hypothetical protein